MSDLDVSPSIAKEIKQDVGEFLVEQILIHAGKQTSPVSGGEWKASLSPEYKKKKVAEGGRPVADLELTGSLLGSIDFRPTEDGIKIGVFGKEARKADGHTNLSEISPLPPREFLPKEGQSFKDSIERGVKEIIDEKLGNAFDRSDFKDVQTRTELFSVLSEIYTGSRAEIRTAVLLNQTLVSMLDDLDLLELLG